MRRVDFGPRECLAHRRLGQLYQNSTESGSVPVPDICWLRRFAARVSGDSGSLVVDSALGSARGLYFAGDKTVSGWSYACELSAIFEMLQIETPCMGGLHSAIRRALARRPSAIVSLQVEGHSLLGDMTSKVDKFRYRYMKNNADGQVAGALEATFQVLAVELAEAVNEDEDFAGLLDEAFGDWLVLPTLFDMLEYRLPDDFDQRVLKAFDHLSHQRPEVKRHASWMREAFSGCGGMKMRELLAVGKEEKSPTTD